jgi:hypothetical protein
LPYSITNEVTCFTVQVLLIEHIRSVFGFHEDHLRAKLKKIEIFDNLNVTGDRRGESRQIECNRGKKVHGSAVHEKYTHVCT